MLDKIRERLMNNRINVGVGDIKIAESPNILATHLGSCISMIIYDQKDKRGGMLHFLLPHNPNDGSAVEKYCDSGVDKLVSYFGNAEAINSSSERYKICIFGGATMIAAGSVDVASMNIDAIKKKLEGMKIKPKIFEVGGKKGYEVLFDCKEGLVYYRRFGEEYKEG